MLTSNKKIGNIYEQLAEKYLLDRKVKILHRNFSCRLGEIDLIIQDGKELAFVEVKYRRQNQHGCPLEAVTRSKQRKIIKTAQFFLQKHGFLYDNVLIRFDVIAVEPNQSRVMQSSQIQWVQNAFEANVW